MRAWLVATVLLLGCDVVAGISGACVVEEGTDPRTTQCRRDPPQCGCPDDQTCRFEGVCGAIGPGREGEPCTTSADCGADMDCADQGEGLGSWCMRFCDRRSDCADLGATSFCLNTLGEPGLGVCSLPCRPGATDDECPEGFTCDAVADLTSCRPRGDRTSNQSCTADAQCAAELTCVNVPVADGSFQDICLPLCGPGLPTCPSPRQCRIATGDTSLRAPGPGEWGACYLVAE